MPDNEKFLEYEQHLGKALKELYFEDKRYEPLRDIIKEQCKDKSDGLVFAVRKNEIHIYYRGGRLLKITATTDGTALKIYTDPDYALDKNNPNGENEIEKLNAADTSQGASVWCENIEKLKKYVIHHYANTRGNAERLLQHKLELNNRDFNGEVVIIDNEYGVRKIAARISHLDRSKQDSFGKFTDSELAILSKREPKLTKDDVLDMTNDELESLRRDYKLCKVDLVALFKGDDGKYKICLTELKKGNDATGGKSGIKDHIRDFTVFTGDRTKDIVKSVENLLKYKTNEKLAGTIANYPSSGIELDREHIYISVLCYDLLSEQKINNVEKEIMQALDDETKKRLPRFYYNLRMKETSDYTLRKADLIKS